MEDTISHIDSFDLQARAFVHYKNSVDSGRFLDGLLVAILKNCVPLLDPFLEPVEESLPLEGTHSELLLDLGFLVGVGDLFLLFGHLVLDFVFDRDLKSIRDALIVNPASRIKHFERV